jgi:hypothetical protein
MEEQQIGWLGAILIGAFAGWLAEKIMKSDHSLLTNIILGVIGAEHRQYDFYLDGYYSRRVAGLPDRGIHRRLPFDRRQQALQKEFLI